MPGASRASAVGPTQNEAIGRARQILANDGGGELQVRGRDGAIRRQDAIAARQRSWAQPGLNS